MFARFLGRKASSSRPSSPITGGYLVTRLAQSYGILSPNFVRNLTRFKDNDLTIQTLSVMRVMVNTGGEGATLEPAEREAKRSNHHNNLRVGYQSTRFKVAYIFI